MFNWVCPQCGKDVPPSKTECPYCEERAREAAAAGIAPPAPVPPFRPLYPPPPPPPQEAWQAPVAPPWSAPVPPVSFAEQPSYTATAPLQQAPQYPPPQQPGPPPAWTGQPPQQPPQYAPPPAQAAWPQNTPGPWPHHPPQRSGPPTWLMVAAFALAFLGIGAAIYFGLQKFSRVNAVEKAGVENPANPSQQKVSNPLQKYVEVVGIRLVAENKKPTARFIVVNHSNAEITDLAAGVTLWASTSRSEEDSVGSFTFKMPTLRPNGSAEMAAPLKTRLKPYELPDWQNLTAEVQITSPAP